MKNLPTIIIAEIGENHLGDINLAKKMIVDAAKSRANIVKFQSYRGRDFKVDDPERDWFTRVELSNESHVELMEIAEKNKIEFLSSPFSLERTRFLCEDLGLRKIKIASGMMLNFPVLDYINYMKIDTVYLSTGMATLNEINTALEHLKDVPNKYLMHCVTQYPCKDEEANLRAILTLQNEFKLPVGYSDHTVGIDACLTAFILGAEVIEKHFTFDKNCPEGTDHIISMTDVELKELVTKINKIELLLGDGVKEPSKGEAEIIEFVRNRFL
jgi:sialic acid synthase SpsE